MRPVPPDESSPSRRRCALLSTTRPDRVLPFTRAVAVAIVPFLVIAAGILYLVPDRTADLFSWTIAPPLTSRLLAAAYIGGIWFFSRVAFSRRWGPVAHGFPAVLLFASLAELATLLHWDRFHLGQLPFVVWVTLYSITPVLVAACLIANGRSAPADSADEVRIPRPMRWAGVAIGVGALAIGLMAFLVPGAFVSGWPWAVTPLTMRIIGAVLTLPGAVNLWLLADPRWSRFRVVVQAELISLLAIGGAVLLGVDDLRWDQAGAPLFTAAIAVSLVAFAGAYSVLERRRRRAA